jgi:hypothetical protein
LFGDDLLLKRVVGVEQRLHVVEASSRMATATTLNSSRKSAVAAGHRRGRNGLTGVTASRFKPSGMIGP